MLLDRLGRRLRAARRVCRTVVLRLRFDDFTRATRSHTMPEATERTSAILLTARGLLLAAHPIIDRDGITLLGLSLTGLEDAAAVQLTLPLEPARGLDRALDAVRDRYGSKAITRAVLLERAEGITMPHLPD